MRKYFFRSIFNRSHVYSIDCDEDLSVYNTFTLKIKKIDDKLKTYNSSNIDCSLVCVDKKTWDSKTIELDNNNFNQYYILVDRFEDAKPCTCLNEAIEIDNSYDNIFASPKEANLDKFKAEYMKFIDELKNNTELFTCFVKIIERQRVISE